MTTFSNDELGAIADLLMGAAAADGRLDRVEKTVIVDALRKLAGLGAPPPELTARVREFDPGSFDLAATCAAIDSTSVERRRLLLQLLARVVEADEILDLDEEHYLKRAARALGAEPAEYADLTLDLELDEAAAEPPPVPR